MTIASLDANDFEPDVGIEQASQRQAPPPATVGEVLGATVVKHGNPTDPGYAVLHPGRRKTARLLRRLGRPRRTPGDVHPLDPFGGTEAPRSLAELALPPRRPPPVRTRSRTSFPIVHSAPVYKHGNKGDPGYHLLHPGVGHARLPKGDSDADDTMAKWRSGDGWDPKRRELHERILADTLRGHSASAHPRALFMGGGSGSGKSTVLKQGHRPNAGVVIDADELKGHLPEYRTMVERRDPRASMFVHEESSMLAKEALRRAAAAKMDFTLDGTGDSDIEKLAGKVAQARAAGHSVDALYVTVDTETAIERVKVRGEHTGRVVPASVVREIHASVSRTFEAAVERDLFDTVELWDTTTNPPTLIGSKPQGGRWMVHDTPAWLRFVAKGRP